MSDLRKEYETKFAAMKKSLNLKSTIKDFDEIFFVNDFIEKEGYVSNDLSRQLSKRISEMYISWLQYLHGLLVPNPQSLVNVFESQQFNDKERRDIQKIIDKVMVLTSKNSLVGLTKDKKQEREFMDESVSLWKKEVNPKLRTIMKKVHDKWIEKSKSKLDIKKPKRDIMYG